MYSGVPFGSCQLNVRRGYRHEWVVVGSQRQQARLCVVQAASGRKLQVVFVTTEVAPWSKVGGLGDVMAALPAALAARGHRVMTVSPLYSNYPDVRNTGVRVPVKLPSDILQHCADQHQQGQESADGHENDVSEQQAVQQTPGSLQQDQQRKLQQDESAEVQATGSVNAAAAHETEMNAACSNNSDDLDVQATAGGVGHARYYMCCSAGVDRVFVDHPLFHGSGPGRGRGKPWPAAIISSYTHPGAMAAGKAAPDLPAAASVLCQAALAAPLLLWGVTGRLNARSQQLQQEEQQSSNQQQEMQLLVDLLGFHSVVAAAGAGLQTESKYEGNDFSMLLAAAAAEQQSKLALHLQYPQQIVSGLAAPVLLGTTGSEVDCRWQVSDLLMQHQRREGRHADLATAEAPVVFVANDWPCGLLPLWLEVFRAQAKHWHQHNPHMTWLKQQQEELFQQVQQRPLHEGWTGRPSVHAAPGAPSAANVSSNNCSGPVADQQQSLQELQRVWQQKLDSNSPQQQEQHQELPAENKAPDPPDEQDSSQDSSSSWSAAADAWLQEVGYHWGSVYDTELAAAVDEAVAAGRVSEEQVRELQVMQCQVQHILQQEQLLGEAVEWLRTAAVELDASSQQQMAVTATEPLSIDGNIGPSSPGVLGYEQQLILLHEMLGRQLAESKVVFAIHNYGYQGMFQGRHHFDRLGLPQRMLSAFVSPVFQKAADAGRVAARVAAAAASAVGSQLAALVEAMQRLGRQVQGNSAGLLASVQHALLQEKKEDLLQQESLQQREQLHGQHPHRLPENHAAEHLQQFDDSSATDPDCVGLNWLRAGLSASDLAVTVSGNYAKEMLTNSWAATGSQHSSCDSMAGLLASKQLRGILNGLDTRCWDPARDPLLPANVRYTADTAATGKAAAKELLQRRLGLTTDARAPLLAFVGRLTPQKGVDVVLAAVPQLMKRDTAAAVTGQQQQQQELVLQTSRWTSAVEAGPTVLQGSPRYFARTTVSQVVMREQDQQACASSIAVGSAQLVMLGTGEPWMEDVLLQLSSKHPGQAVGIPDFNEPLAHLILAAADFLLVPSRFEPCGLVALAGLRYGAVPVASMTGGLTDIITPDVGYLIPNPGPEGDTARFRRGVVGLVDAVQQALQEYGTERFSSKRCAAMAVDVSWEGPSEAWEQVLLQAVEGDAAAGAGAHAAGPAESSICSAR